LIEKKYEELVQAGNKISRYSPDQMQKMASLNTFHELTTSLMRCGT